MPKSPEFTAISSTDRSGTRDHRPGCGFGEESRLGRLYCADGNVLLLGAGHANNTSLHLAEYRASFPGKRTHTEGAPVSVEGERRWMQFDELVWKDDDFAVGWMERNR